jgi:DNA polymerase-3 subunit beta
MKLSVTQENLSRALGTVSRVASTRTSLPVLSNVLIKTNDNRLTIAATNLDIAVTETIGAKITQQGALTVPARLMQDFVASLPSGPLELEVKDNKLSLHTDRYDSTINGVSADEFPAMPTLENSKELVLTGKELKEALGQVLFAASSDEARPVLTAVFLHTNEKSLYFAATDSYRLAERSLKSNAKDISLLIPAHSLQEVLRAVKDDTEQVVIAYDEQQARFSVGETEIVTRLIEGSYPDYKKLLPKSFETTATLTKQSMSEITKVSSLFAREAAGSITLTIDQSKKEISINSIASQVGENTASAEAVVTGDATITLNSRYILDALSAFNGEKIQINVNGKLDPCVLTDPDNAAYVHVIMPVKS